MYNGIGLPTARGSGTNGYVQRNLAHVNKKRQTRPDMPDPDINKGPNPELVLHQKKREIESKCFKYRLELEEEGWKDADIEKKVSNYRRRLSAGQLKEGTRSDDS